MTISQLLRKIKKVKGDIQENRSRAQGATVYDSNEPPAFDFKASREAAEKAVSELIKLETALRRANANTVIATPRGDLSLSEATCTLAELKSQLAWLRSLPVQAQPERKVDSVEYDSVSRQPYKKTTTYVCPFTESARAADLKAVQEAFDELNDLVETANHRTAVEL